MAATPKPVRKYLKKEMHEMRKSPHKHLATHEASKSGSKSLIKKSIKEAHKQSKKDIKHLGEKFNVKKYTQHDPEYIEQRKKAHAHMKKHGK